MDKLTNEEAKIVIGFLDDYFKKISVTASLGVISVNHASFLLDMSLYLHNRVNDEENHHALCWMNKKILEVINTQQKYSDPYPPELLINNIKSLQIGIDGIK